MATITTPDSTALVSDVGLPERFEVVDGQVVEIPPMGAQPGYLASTLTEFLGVFVRSQRLGRVAAEVLFGLGDGRNRRIPDVAFVSYDRWPRRRAVPTSAAWPVVPDLAIEVVSPTDEAEAVLGKVREYFDAGVRAVWVVYPAQQVVHQYATFTTIRALTRADTADGGAVLPGFALPLADLFEDADEE